MEKNYDILNQKLHQRNGMSQFLMALGFVSVVIGMIVFVNYLINTNMSYQIHKQDNGNLDLASSGQLGDFIGGIVGTIFSLSGFFLLYLTFKNQRESFEKERFENRFFELIKFHRENVNEFEFKTKDRVTVNGIPKLRYDISKGKKVFKIILNQTESCFLETRAIFSALPIESILTADYLNELRNDKYFKSNQINLHEYARLNFCYLVVFFGLDRNGIKSIEHILKGKYQSRFYVPTLKYMALKPEKDSLFWPKWEKINKLKVLNKFRITEMNRQFQAGLLMPNRATDRLCYSKKYFKFYGGHQLRLGHYFRHLFQTINYVNKQEYFDYQEKYDYIKILRAQLSTHEQALLFINSISLIGNVWEIKSKARTNLTSDKIELFNNQLITKYNLIKNVPGESLLQNISFRRYYPNVSYEGENESNEKEILKTYYK